VIAIVPTPIRRQRLHRALLTAAGSHDPSTETVKQEQTNREAPSSKASSGGGLRILVAEDNLVNQKVALRLLEKLDYRATAVADGRAAVAAWQAGNFDLILMDCQMPQMDGYAATREIRRLEDGKRHVPIVALTAHAMKGDEERCRSAGMDDYLTKPINREELEACLERHISGAGAMGSVPPKQDSPVNASGGNDPVEWEALLQSIDGDEGFARELVAAIVGTGSRELSAIAAALAAGDAAALRKSAHVLNGASANLRAKAASLAAVRLEEAAGRADSARMSALADDLTNEVNRMIEFLKSKVG